MLPGNFSCFFLLSADFFKINFFEKFFKEYHLSVRLDPDQAQGFVGPDLGPNCLTNFSADDTRAKYPHHTF